MQLSQLDRKTEMSQQDPLLQESATMASTAKLD